MSRTAPFPSVDRSRRRGRPLRLVQAAVMALPAIACAAATGVDDGHIVYRTVPGDTLIGIAAAMLQRPTDWPRLQRLNRIADPRRMATGAALRIPVALLRREPQTASVAQVTGSARVGDQALQPGERIASGTALATDDGYVTLELPDGSTLTLQPRSRLRVDTLYRHRNTEIQRSAVSLEAGRVEAAVPKHAPRSAPSQQIRTPGAVISVRGTRYRAAVEAGDVSRVEVTEGVVGVDSGTRRAVALNQGYGLLAAAGKPAQPPIPLLPAPDLTATPELQLRPALAVGFATVADAHRYRVQVSADPQLRDIRADRVVDSAQTKIAGLPDGDYWLRVRAIDGEGFEGLEQVKALRLRARPEPPFPSAPADGTRLRASHITLRWTQALDAAAYEIQLADDAAFARLLQSSSGQPQTEFSPPGELAPGHYYWRVASLRADGYRGPYGDVQRFELRAPPAEPEPPEVDDNRITFAWPGEAGQSFEFQLARDPQFADVLETRRLEEPRTAIDRPAPGSYFLRVRATDADGFVGPYTATQRIEVPSRPWWLLLLLLVPLL